VVPFVYLFSTYGLTFSTDVEPVPGWFSISFGLCYFMNRMLDEIDGKQARRTGNSSALGMLFDHGCDAFTVGMVMMCMCRIVNMGDSVYTMAVILGANCIFHFCTLEGYYLGGVFLGKFNAITDLSVLVIGICIYVGCFGNEQFTDTLITQGTFFSSQPDLCLNNILVIISYSI